MNTQNGDVFSMATDTQLERVDLIATHILDQIAGEEDCRLSGKEIFERALKQNPDMGIPMSSFRVCLSVLASDPTSFITRDPGINGYYLAGDDDTVAYETVTPTEDEHEPHEDAARILSYRALEPMLYPLLVKWLISKGYYSRDTSRVKSNGGWGNTDITGIKLTSVLGSIAVSEIVTIEAKCTHRNWERDIFQAVSHKRFAMRSFYAFVCDASQISKIQDKLQYHCELYGIGVIALSMSPEDYRAYLNFVSGGSKTFDDFEDKATPVMLHPAPYTSVREDKQSSYLESLGIKVMEDLLMWTREAAESN